MRIQIVYGVVAMLSLLDVPVFGQSFRLSIGIVEGGFQDMVEIPLRFSTDTDVQAVQAVFDWDASDGEGVALNVAPAVADQAEFVSIHVDANWMAVGITSVGTPLTGNGIHLADLVINCHAGPGGTDTPIVFRDGVHNLPGSPALSNTVTVDGQSRTSAHGLALSDGGFSCVGLEICDDLVDNDGDGLVDAADPDCASPEVVVTPPSLDYGQILIGCTSTLEVTIRNAGTAELHVSDIELGVATSPFFEISGVPATPAGIAPGAQVVVAVTYAPQDEESHSGTLRILSDDADEGEVVVPLSGTGGAGAEPEVVVTPSSLDYGQVRIGRTSTLNVAIRNAGTAELRVSKIEFGVATSQFFGIRGLPVTPAGIAPGAQALVAVTYAPQDEESHSGTLRVFSDDGDEGEVVVPLSGTGGARAEPEVVVTPSSLDYGQVRIGRTSTLNVAIRNAGTAELRVSNIEFGVATSQFFGIRGLPATPAGIAPGAQVVVAVTYAPQDEESHSGTLRVFSDDGDEGEVVVSLAGTGISTGLLSLAGDCDQDGLRNMSDVICMVRVLFPGFNLLNRSTQAAPCSTDDGTTQVLDLSGDSQVDGLDVMLLAQFLFEGGAPPAQGLECFRVGESLGCSENSLCP